MEPLNFAISDDATNFVAADNDLQLISKRSPLQDFLANNEIKWKFILPNAPHFGGVWERLIPSCKDALYSVLGSQTLTDNTFATTLNEIEAFLNNRPITDIPTDINDTDALTPNHFLAKQFGSSKISHREVFGQLEEYQLSTTTTHSSHVSTKSRQMQELSKFQVFAWHQ